MPTVQEILTSSGAAIGLGLSIYNTIQARRDKRPMLQVRMSYGFLTYGRELGDQRMIFFQIANAWNQTITLASLSIPLSGNQSLSFFNLAGEKEMPVILAPGTSTKFWLGANELEAETIKAGVTPHSKFRVMARDALGNEYLSNRISFRPVSE